MVSNVNLIQTWMHVLLGWIFHRNVEILFNTKTKYTALFEKQTWIPKDEGNNRCYVHELNAFRFINVLFI